MWKVLSLLRKCVVSQLVSSGQRLTSSFSNLTPYWGSLCSLLHPLCAWPALPVYITTLFILCFSHFQHNWEIVLGTPRQQTEKKEEPSLLSWKAVTLLEAFIPSGSVWMSLLIPSGPPPSFLVLCFVHRGSKHFLACSYGKCDIYKRDHLSACALHSGSCAIWCPWLKIWVADTANVR